MYALNINKNAYFMFDPEKTHYTNSMAIFRAIRKRIYERYYGLQSSKQDKKHKNAFRNCKTPLEIFNL